jgi:hypothetical protein
MQRWSGSGVTGGDPNAARRTAAQAILQTRLTQQSLSATDALRSTIDDYQRESSRQTRWLIRLTWTIAALTAGLLALAVHDLLARAH